MDIHHNKKLNELKDKAIKAGQKYAKCEVDYFNALSEEMMNCINSDIKNGIKYKIYDTFDEVSIYDKEIMEILDFEKCNDTDDPFSVYQLEPMFKLKYKQDNLIYEDEVYGCYIVKK